MQRYVPFVDRQAIDPLQLISQADAQGRLRPFARRPVVVPSPAAEAVAQQVPADHRQKHDAARRDANFLRAARGGNVPSSRDEVVLAAVANKSHLIAADKRQSDRQAFAQSARDDRRSADLAVRSAIREDRVATAQQVETMHRIVDERSAALSTCSVEAQALSAQAAAYRFLAYHPSRRVIGTGTCNSVG